MRDLLLFRLYFVLLIFNNPERTITGFIAFRTVRSMYGIITVTTFAGTTFDVQGMSFVPFIL
ncbi:MAG: hypothetical protein L6Q49_13250 [Anaerolineales bacterium]|nr:hypothetical protein [Anaerolineales bacterium]